jgi:hypothetical protein
MLRITNLVKTRGPAAPGATTICTADAYALISPQEHEAWYVLLACQGQLRLAPSGHVTASLWTRRSGWRGRGVVC